jgi:nucleoid-associated protein YgaU
MSIEKLTIYHEQSSAGVYSGTIEALFNPNELTFSKSIRWESEDSFSTKTSTAARKTRFTSMDPETLTINLFFDVYEAAGKIKGSALSFLYSYPSVFSQTEKLGALGRCVKDRHRPPVCKLQWGKRTLFLGVLTHIEQRVTLFLEDGTPVRATVTCTFQEVTTSYTAVRDELYSPDVEKTYVVRPGDTLSRIAAELYEDPSLWRAIAEANGIDNPRRLTPGQVLFIPKLT